MYEHIKELLVIFNDHRLNAKLHFQQIFSKVKVLAEKIGVSLMLPRQCSRQRNRCNTAMEEYYRLSIFIPYLDSLISSLQIRFSPENRFTFSLCALHSLYLLHHTKEEYFNEIDQISSIIKLIILKQKPLLGLSYGPEGCKKSQLLRKDLKAY